MKIISAYSVQFKSNDTDLSLLFDGIVNDMQRLRTSLERLKKVRANEHIAMVKGIRTFLMDLNQQTTNQVVSMTIRFLNINGKNYESYPVSVRYKQIYEFLFFLTYLTFEIFHIFAIYSWIMRGLI